MQSSNLRIKSITLTNFKSYYGEQIIGPFDASFTAVIGPNGSGKSNLIESLLFVFGKKARSLRANQLHHLIHNSVAHPNLSSASVEVMFIDQNGSPVSLKRVVYHTSLSKYYMDDQETTHDSVLQMLKQRGLNIKHNRFLVLQGEVEQIFSMKAKSGQRDAPGLLEFLEETIGTATLRDEMDLIGDKLIVLDDRRTENGERSRLARSALEQIYPVVRTYVVGLSNKLFQSIYHNLVLQVSVLGLQFNIEEYQSIIKSKEQQIDQIYSSCECNTPSISIYLIAIRQQSESVSALIKEINTKRYNKLGKQQELNRQLNLLGDQNAAVSSQLGSAQEVLITLSKKRKLIDKELVQHTTEITTKNDTLPGLQERLNAMLEQRTNMEEDLSIQTQAIQEKTSELYRKKKELENNIYPYERTKLDLENEIDWMQQRLKQMHRESEKRSQEQIDLRQKNTQSDLQCNEIQMIINKFQDILQKIDQQKLIMIQRMTTKQHELDSIRGKIQQLDEIITQNQQSNEEQSARYMLLQEIKRASQRGLIPTICGRLGDLATIDSKFDVAITVACPQLDHIVVHTYFYYLCPNNNSNSDALKCIEYLKVSKLGRCTFSIVERVPIEVQQFINKEYIPPKRSQRLFDLLKFKNELFKPIFYNFLRDTLVAETLQEATYTAFNTGSRKRVVTLDGKLIEGTGIISGGGRARKGGMASSFKNEVTQEELIKLKAEKLHLQQALSEGEAASQSTNQKLNEIQRDEQDSKIRYKKNLVDLELLRDQIRENNLRLEQMPEPDVKVQQQLESSISKKKEMIFELDTKMEQDRFQIRMIDVQVRKYGGESFDQAKESTNQIVLLHEQYENEVQKLKAQIQLLNQKISQLEEAREDNQACVIVCEDNIKTQMEALKGIEDISIQVQLYIQNVKLVNKDNRIKKKLVQITNELKEFDQAQLQLKNQIQMVQNEIGQVETEKNQIKDRNNKLIETQLDYQSELTLQEEEYNQTLQEFTSSQGNYLINAFEVVINDDEISFDNLFFKSFQKYRLKFIQAIKENFISNCLDLIPDRLPLHLQTYELKELEVLIQNQNILEDISQENQRNENFTFDSTILMEFIKRSKEFRDRVITLEQAQKDYQEFKSKFDSLRMKRKNKFNEGFTQIASKLREIYQHLSCGGDADLDLIDSLDPFSEGVSFQVRPKNKTWKTLSRLSGGEKTLSSLSLLLAIHFYKPNSFYFFDEIDAALDYKNVGIVAKYIKEQSHDTQFSIISLRNNMFEESSKLVGIYKVNDTSMTLVVNPSQFLQELE